MNENKIFIYLLNKNDEPTALDFEINGYSFLSVEQALCFQDPEITQNISVQQEDTNYVIEVPEYSLTKIEFLVE